jgi:apolipoprotein D and lipocalin family protein
MKFELAFALPLLRAAHLAVAMYALHVPVADCAPPGKQPLKTVEKVDLARYVGQWYEIARYPNRFERDCASDVIATYATRPDGKIQVVNTCRKGDGALKTARGNARIVDTRSNAKLKVTFFWPFYGDYWVIALDSDYRYAVVGEPGRKYLWILSRTAELDDATYREILNQIAATGYDPERLVKTSQKR